MRSQELIEWCNEKSQNYPDEIFFFSCDFVDDNFKIFYHHESSTHAKCLISCQIAEDVQYSVAVTLIINNFQMHLKSFKIKYQSLINDCGKNILKGERTSNLDPNTLFCCTGVSVVNFAAGIANGETLKYDGNFVEFDPEAIKYLRKQNVHNFSGMSNVNNFKSLENHLEEFKNGSLNFKKEFVDFIEQLEWYRKKLETSFVIQGEYLTKLKTFYQMLKKWSEGNDWLTKLKRTINFFLNLIAKGVTVKFCFLSLYQPEMLCKKNRSKGNVSRMRANLKEAGSEAINLGYDLTFLNDRMYTTCNCDKDCVHYGKERFECNICKETLVSRRKITSHLIRHYKNEEESTKIDHFECPHCYAKFEDKSTLRRHVKNHKFDKFKCQKCPLEFILEEDLSRHEEEHASKQFKCENCHMLFGWRSSLNRHKSSRCKSLKHK